MTLEGLSIIIPTKDRGDIFYNTIKCAFHSLKDYKDFEIIVINDSKIDQPVIFDIFEEKIKIYDNSKNGVASARNLGASLAKYKWILFLDDDMIMSKENLNSYLKYLNRSDKFCVNIDWEYPPSVIKSMSQKAFGRFLIKFGFTTMRGWNNNPKWPINSSIEVSSMASPNLLINKNFFLETGGYDESFPHAGFEDYAFSKRLEKYHFKMYVDTTSIMYHNEEDRLLSDEWLKRKERGGQTRRVGVNNGYGEIEIKYNLPKKIFYSMYRVMIPIFKKITSITDNYKFLDPISFSCYKFLLGIYIYKGYTKHD